MMKDVGNAKVLLSKQLKNSENILTMLLGKDYEDKYEDVEEEIGKHIFDCLFIEGAEHILTKIESADFEKEIIEPNKERNLL